MKYWFLFQEKKVGDSSKRETTGSGRNKTEKTVSHYDVEITNRSGVPVKDISAKYMVAVRRKWGGKTGKKSTFYLQGEGSIPFLDNTGRETLRLKDIELFDAKWQKTKTVRMTDSNGRSYNAKKVYNYRAEYFLDGIWVKLFIGGNEVAEYKSKEESIVNACVG